MHTHDLVMSVLVADRRARHTSAATGRLVDGDRVRLRRRSLPRTVPSPPVGPS